MKKIILFFLLGLMCFSPKERSVEKIIPEFSPSLLTQGGLNFIFPPRISSPPPVAEFDKAFKKQKAMVVDIFDFSNWEDIKLEHKKNNHVINFKDMSELDKSLFCLTMGERTSIAFQKLTEAWNDELKKYEFIQEPPADLPDRSALKTEIESYLAKLKVINLDFHKEYLKYAEKVFTQFEKEIPKADRESYIQRLKKKVE